MQLTVAAAAAAFVSIALAQSGYTESSDGTIVCDMPNATYCAGGDIIIRCTNGVGTPGNCNDNLSGFGGDDGTATCWSGCGALSGLAACAKNGTVHPDNGATFPTAATGICPIMNSTTNTTAATGPMVTGSTPYANGTATNGTSPQCNCTEGGVPTTSPAAAAGATVTASNTPVAPSAGASASSTAYQAAASVTSVSMMGAGAVVGFVALFAALAML